jgi:multisubunit Na+/H+ antiporter MnhB subunit
MPAEPGRPLSIRAIVVGGLVLGAVGAVAVSLLLYLYGGGTDKDKAKLDVVRTAGTLVVGTGGAAALLLAALRQRSTELTLEHQREVAVAQ